jgi:cell division protein FtsL
MTDYILADEKKQFQSKNYKTTFSLFLFIIILIGLLVIGYICSNIVLMKLGYQSIELEQKRDQLLVERNHLEYSVERLSSLTRIEGIAKLELGMCRAENIKFIAMLPADLNIASMVAEMPSEEKESKGYLQAGNTLQEFANLQFFRNQ